MSIERIIATTTVAVALVACSAPGAVAGTGQHLCRTGHSDGVHAELWALGDTSCALAVSAGRVAVRRDYPRRIRAWSSVTHRYYTLRRIDYTNTSTRFQAVYIGTAARDNIGIQIRGSAR